MSLGGIPELEELRERRRIVRLVLPYATAALVYHVAASCLARLAHVSLLAVLEPYVIAVLACVAASVVLSYLAESRAHVVAGIVGDVLPLVSAGVVLLLMCPIVVSYSHMQTLGSFIRALAYVMFAVIPLVLTSGFCMFMQDSETRALAYVLAAAPLAGLVYFIASRFVDNFASAIPLVYGVVLATSGQRYSKTRSGDRGRVAYVISTLALVALLIVLYFVYLRTLLLRFVPQLVKYMIFVDCAVVGSLVLVGGLAVSSLAARGEEPLVLDEVVSRIVERYFLRNEDYVAGLVSRLLRSFIVEGKKASLYMLVLRISRSRAIPDYFLDEAVKLIDSYRDVPSSGLLSAWQSALVARMNVARRIGLVHAVLKILQGLPLTEEDVKLVEVDVRYLLSRWKSGLVKLGQALAYASCVCVILCPVLVLFLRLWPMIVLFGLAAVLSIHLSQYVPSPTSSVLGSVRDVLKVVMLRKKDMNMFATVRGIK